MRAARAASAFDSWITPTTAFSTTMIMMATASTISPRSRETTAAIIRMMTRKLLNWPRSIGRKPGRGFSVSSLGPYFLSRSAASSGVRPFSRWVANWFSMSLMGTYGIQIFHDFSFTSISVDITRSFYRRLKILKMRTGLLFPTPHSSFELSRIMWKSSRQNGHRRSCLTLA